MEARVGAPKQEHHFLPAHVRQACKESFPDDPSGNDGVELQHNGCFQGERVQKQKQRLQAKQNEENEEKLSGIFFLSKFREQNKGS